MSKAARHFLGWAVRRGYASGELVSAVERFGTGKGGVDWLGWEEVTGCSPRSRSPGCGSPAPGSSAPVVGSVRRSPPSRRTFAGATSSRCSRGRSRSEDPPGTHRLAAASGSAQLLEETRARTGRNRAGRSSGIARDAVSGGSSIPRHAITQRTINNALKAARDQAGLTTPLTPHVCRHSFCTNWINEHGQASSRWRSSPDSSAPRSAVLRKTYVHLSFTPDDWDDLRSFGSPKARATAKVGPGGRLPRPAVTEPRRTGAR